MIKKITDSTHKKIIPLWTQGMIYKKIAATTGTSKSTVSKTIALSRSSELTKRPLFDKAHPWVIKRIRSSLKKP